MQEDGLFGIFAQPAGSPVVRLASLSTKRFRRATRSERKVLLRGMLDAPFEDPSDDPITAKDRELWKPIYESTLRPVIESIRE